MKTKIHNRASSVGQRIKKAREIMGFSQQELGEKLYKTGAAIGYIERGKRGINVEDLETLAGVLNVPISYFFMDEISDSQRLQQALSELQKHIVRLNKTISSQAKTIEDLIRKLPTNNTLRLISESSVDTITLIDDKGYIRYVTPSIYDLMGFSGEQIVGKNIDDIVTKDNIKSSRDIFTRVFSSQKVIAGRTQLLHANGHAVDVEINANLVINKGQKMIHAVVRDVSQRR